MIYFVSVSNARQRYKLCILFQDLGYDITEQSRWTEPFSPITKGEVIQVSKDHTVLVTVNSNGKVSVLKDMPKVSEPFYFSGDHISLRSRQLIRYAQKWKYLIDFI